MTVRELVELLQSYPQDLPVAYQLYSEQCLLEPRDITTAELSEARTDGWVASKRPGQPSRPYLLLPGN